MQHKLTGNNSDGIKLLQTYLDATGDIQSTSLIAVRAFPAELITDIVKDWIKKYDALIRRSWVHCNHISILVTKTYWIHGNCGTNARNLM